MVEQDYEVDENGLKTADCWKISVDDLKIKSTELKKVHNTTKKEKKKLKKQKLEQNKTAKAKRLPTTKCPQCDLILTQKALARHQRNQHGENIPKFKCKFCTYESNRHAQVLDHEHRIHLQPSVLGRPKKNKKKTEARPVSSTVIKDDLHLDLSKLAAEVREQHVNLQQTQIRLSILEKKQKKEKLPDLNDLKGLLAYFGLDETAKLDEIRDVINIRIMEVSPESLVESALNEEMDEDQRDEVVSFLNQASVILLQWKSKQNQ